MRRSRFLSSLGLLSSFALAAAGCGDFGDGDIIGPPPDSDPPIGPSDPPPTGSKWEGIEVEDACGRVKLGYVLVDEVCGGTDDPFYMDYFHAPIMRDGAQIGEHLFAVDATHLWVLDVTNADEPKREALLAGFGQPMSVAAFEGRLLIAAGHEGLLLVDVSSPSDPLRIADVALDGPALDVYIEGTTAYVATGAGGIAVVDITGDALELRSVLEVPGFAAAVAAREGVAYVAACDTFATIDVATGALLGQGWVEGAYKDDILVAPAKDVSLSGDVAFVAAGRFGAVSVDIADPASPSPRGNCTLVDEEAFYASGVREQNGTLYVAGGEWGILPVDVAEPSLACADVQPPALPLPPEDEETCSTEPPWEVLPWTETWSPPSVPPEGRDPLQTLPVEGRIYAFGDATRIGLRAIDIRNPLNLDEKFGRYNEPRLTEGIAAQGNVVLVAGKAGGLFATGPGGELELIESLPEAKLARAAAFLGDGRWALGGLHPESAGGAVYIEGAPSPLLFDTPIWAGGFAAKASTVYVPTALGVFAQDVDTTQITFPTGREAHLPQSIAVGEDHLLVAAPEWTSAIRVDSIGSTPLSPIATFDERDVQDVGLWRKSLPRRVVLTGPAGFVEVSSLGGRAGITLHATDAPTSTELPAGDYIAATMTDDHVYAVAFDRGRYRTQLVTIEITEGTLAVTGVTAFAGAATGVATSGDRLYVADGDRGIRVFDVADGDPAPMQVLDLQALDLQTSEQP